MSSPESGTEPEPTSSDPVGSPTPPAIVAEEPQARNHTPTPVSPHITRLKRRKDGPYFVTPDSVEPLPSDMWSDLDPETVEKEAATFPELVAVSPSTDPDDPRPRNVVPAPQREFLQRLGAAGAGLLTELERGL